MRLPNSTRFSSESMTTVTVLAGVNPVGLVTCPAVALNADVSSSAGRTMLFKRFDLQWSPTGETLTPGTSPGSVVTSPQSWIAQPLAVDSNGTIVPLCRPKVLATNVPTKQSFTVPNWMLGCVNAGSATAVMTLQVRQIGTTTTNQSFTVLIRSHGDITTQNAIAF